jgi:hypothetical protein
MNVLTIILGLSLACAPAQVGSKLDMTGPQALKNFCEVMKNPKIFQDKPITLEAKANVLYGGILLKSDECNAPDVTVHYLQDYERQSNAEALALLQRLERQVHGAHESGAGIRAEQVIVSVVLEGRFTRNPNYHMKSDRGSATLAAWDFQYEYAFVVTRVVCIKNPN